MGFPILAPALRIALALFSRRAAALSLVWSTGVPPFLARGAAAAVGKCGPRAALQPADLRHGPCAGALHD
eukprot:363816-Amphidinium_carterae.1